jgi:ABC-2 type transport system ATP-binding protein
MLALTQKVVQPVNEGIEKVAIEVRDLHKTYSGKKAVDGISFAVRHNEIFGILGPNGAGKSTALEIIEGLRQPDKNPTTAVRVDGLNVLNPKECRELKQRMGLQLQSSSLFPELSVRENLQMLAMLYRRARPVDGLLQEFDLTEKANALSLAAALVNDPSIVFLDEPTTALDPQARRNVWESVRRLQSSGKTVVLTTHYMEEAQMLCERVAIMDNGRIAALGTPEQLIRQYAPGQAIDCRYAEGSPQLDETVLRALPGATEVSCHAHNAVIQTRDLSATLLALLSAGENHNARFSEVITRSPSLEDVFLNVTGKKLGNE